MAGATVDVNKWLAGMGKKWKGDAKRAKEEGGFGPKMDDGTYQARLTAANLVPISGGAGGFRSKLNFVITEGPNTGKPAVKSDGLDGEDSLYWLAATLGRLGIDPETVDLPELPKIFAKLEKDKPLCEISLKTGSNGFQNVYVNTVVDDGSGAAGSAPAATSGEDETEEETPAAAEEEAEVELAVGLKVAFTFKGKEETGEVVEILAEEDPPMVRVRKDSDTKVARVKIESLSFAGGEDADETE